MSGMSTPHYAYLDCEDAQKWAGHERIAYSLLHPGATWEHFRLYRGELPALESLGRFTGVLISGSHYSAYEEHQWIRDLEAWLRQAVPQYPSVKFLGMCFGCQVLATALGGSVGKNPDGGFVLKVENICLREQLQRSAALRLAAADVASSGGESSSSDCSDSGGAAASPVPSVCLIQSHGDAVLRLPPGATLLAESSTAAVEIFGLPNVLAVQGHAELRREDTLEKIWPAITAAGRLTAEEAAESRRSIAEDPIDALLVVALYRRFMERGLPELGEEGGPATAS